MHSLVILGVTLLQNLMIDHLLDTILEQAKFRESSSIVVHPSHSNCLEFGAIILAQGVQCTHDYVLIFGGEFLLVPTNYLGSSLQQCGPMARLHDQVCQHIILYARTSDSRSVLKLHELCSRANLARFFLHQMTMSFP
jgi:hypothetical protein